MYTAMPEINHPKRPKKKLYRPKKAVVKDAPMKLSPVAVDVEGGGARVVDARPAARRRVPNLWALGVDHHVCQCARPLRAIGSPLAAPSGLDSAEGTGLALPVGIYIILEGALRQCMMHEHALNTCSMAHYRWCIEPPDIFHTQWREVYN